MIATCLEVKHGIENLFVTTMSGVKHTPNYGQFIPQHYFHAFVLGFPHLWSPEVL